MRIYFTYLFFSIILMQQSASAQFYGWINAFHSTHDVGEPGICLDPDKNVYSMGVFWDINFGTASLSVPNGNGYLVKHDKDGNYLWSRTIIESSTFGFNLYSMCTSTNGNVVVVGGSSADSLVIGNFTLTNSSSPQACCFAACFDPNGNVVWAKTSLATGDIFPRAVASDGTNFYVTGMFVCSAVYFGSHLVVNAGDGTNRNAFVVKYDANGNELWAKGIGGTGSDDAMGIACDKDGGAYVAGGCWSPTLTIGNSTFNPVNGDALLVKYDPLGNVSWARTYGDNNSESGISISVDENKNIYMAGAFNPCFHVANVTLCNTGCNPSSAFLMKLDPGGQPIWATGGGGDQLNGIKSLSAFNNGVYASGFSSGKFVIANYTINATPTTDADFLIKFDGAGNIECGTSIYSKGYGNYVCTDNTGDKAYTTGVWGNTLFKLGSVYLQNTTPENIYMAEFSCQSGVGLAELSKNDAWNVFPNPSSGTFTINGTQDDEVVIYNELSQELRKIQLDETNNYKVTVNNMAPGIYFVKGTRANFKVIVE